MSEPRDQELQDRRTDGQEPLSTAAMAGAGDSTAEQAAVQPAVEPREFESSHERQGAEDAAPVFPSQEAQELRGRWDNIQAGFVDEPRRAVEEADELVAQTMKRLAESFAEERARLEGQWDRGDNVSTEDLRIALRRYRAFFGRLLSA
jgi:hypothetical protein